MAEEEALHSFWSIVVLPGEKKALDIPDDCYCVISNVCIAGFPTDLTGAQRLKANITTIPIDAEIEGEIVKRTSMIALASLLPGQREHAQLHHQFSPLDLIELVNDSKAEYHISGYYMPLEAEDSEFEEEDGEEEEEKEEAAPAPEEIKGRYKNYARRVIQKQ